MHVINKSYKLCEAKTDRTESRNKIYLQLHLIWRPHQDHSLSLNNSKENQTENQQGHGEIQQHHQPTGSN